MNEKAPSPSRRFNALWVAAQDDGSSLIAHVDAPYVSGSLRPEVKSVGGIVLGNLYGVSNTEAAFSPDSPQVLTALAALETLK